jgi:hypothetical protein
MLVKDFKKAIAEGKMFLMKKYKAYGEWGSAKLVTAEVAERKAKVLVQSIDEFGEKEWHCPYCFELAE